MIPDALVAELLAGPLNEFTNRRNAKAKGLKAGGKPDLAMEVASLRKPPVSVWAVNQLAGQNRQLLDRLRRAGAVVVEAQQGAVTGQRNAAQELRSASDALQREVDAGVRATAQALRAGGHAADEATMRRVQEMFRLAAVTGGETWERLRDGALITEPRAGEDMLTAAFALGPSLAGRPRLTVVKRPDPAADRAADRAAVKQVADTEKRIALEHAERTAKLDAEAAQQADQTARRLREEASRMAADVKRANEKAKQAERESARASAKAKTSADAAQRLR